MHGYFSYFANNTEIGFDLDCEVVDQGEVMPVEVLKGGRRMVGFHLTASEMAELGQAMVRIAERMDPSLKLSREEQLTEAARRILAQLEV